MAALVVKWKARISRGWAIAALCMMLIVSSQVSTMLPMDRYGFSFMNEAIVLETSGRTKKDSYDGDPFTHHHISKNTNSSRAQSFNRKIRLQGYEQMQVAAYSEQGIAGPIVLLRHKSMRLLAKIVSDWAELKIRLRERLVHAGFDGPSDRTCFLWLEDCYDLGKHQSIVKVAETILGHPVLLFGMSLWNAPPKSQQAIDLKYEGFQCETVDVLVNSGIHYIENTHLMTRQMALKIASQMKAVRRLYGDGSPFLQQRFETLVRLYLRDKLPEGDLRVLDVDSGESGEAHVINGRLLYAASNPTDHVRTSMLLQFVSANCTFRDLIPEQVNTQLMLVTRSLIPPTLLASDTGRHGLAGTDGRNDVREVLMQNDVLRFSKSSDNRHYKLLEPLPGSTITVIGKQVNDYSGFARSTLLTRITVEKVFTNESRVAFKSYAENQLVVVMKGALNHHHARRQGYREVRELKSGDLAFLANTDVHALTTDHAAEYLRIRWVGKDGYFATSREGRKSIRNGRQLFEMPVNDLGAINAKTMVLRPGQAYDPENELDCDVLIVTVSGFHLQLIPGQYSVQANQVVLIPAGESCLLWNSGSASITIVALQLYRSLDRSLMDENLLEAAYRTRGKVM